MISAWLIPYKASGPHAGLLRNSIPTLKKKRSDLNSRLLPGFCCLLTSRNPFAGRKKSFYTSEIRLVFSRGEMDEKIDTSVTTSHLVRPNEQRKCAFLLPIWLPNPNSLSKSAVRTPKGAEVNRTRPAEVPYLLEDYSWDYIKDEIYDAMSKRYQNQKITGNTENEKRQQQT